jgi:hypothetical protein
MCSNDIETVKINLNFASEIYKSIGHKYGIKMVDDIMSDIQAFNKKFRMRRLLKELDPEMIIEYRYKYQYQYIK